VKHSRCVNPRTAYKLLVQHRFSDRDLWLEIGLSDVLGARCIVSLKWNTEVLASFFFAYLKCVQIERSYLSASFRFNATREWSISCR